MRSFETIVRDPDVINIVLSINPSHKPKPASTIMNDTYSFITTASTILEKHPLNPTDDVTAATTKFHEEHPAVLASGNTPEIPAVSKLYFCNVFLDRFKNILNETIAVEAINSFEDHPDRKLSITNHLIQLWQNITISYTCNQRRRYSLQNNDYFTNLLAEELDQLWTDHLANPKTCKTINMDINLNLHTTVSEEDFDPLNIEHLTAFSSDKYVPPPDATSPLPTTSSSQTQPQIIV